MKTIIKVFIVFLVCFFVGLALFRILNGGEDNWIKDEKGVYVKHGNPSSMPDNVIEQQDAVSCALDLFARAKQATMLNSQCLGTCGDYAVDVVNVPRTDDDNKPENQCTDFREGKVTRFIELDKNGEIVRIG
jgi:hypothetical protein